MDIVLYIIFMNSPFIKLKTGHLNLSLFDLYRKSTLDLVMMMSNLESGQTIRFKNLRI